MDERRQIDEAINRVLRHERSAANAVEQCRVEARAETRTERLQAYCDQVTERAIRALRRDADVELARLDAQTRAQDDPERLQRLVQALASSLLEIEE